MQESSEAMLDLEWPTTDLEHLGRCPACDGTRRIRLYGSLRDCTFGAAPGAWTMWQCEECMVAYLDPRPTEESIGRAYSHYYTQTPLDNSYCESVFTDPTFKARLRLGYFNSRYGYHFTKGLWIGAMVAAMMANKRAGPDHLIRHLPAPSVPRAPLLGVGCGNGAFLLIARCLGFAPTGLEPEAAKTARGFGLDV